VEVVAHHSVLAQMQSVEAARVAAEDAAVALAEEHAVRLKVAERTEMAELQRGVKLQQALRFASAVYCPRWRSDRAGTDGAACGVLTHPAESLFPRQV
jgi:hypothetical protein